jgi:hypothetical protein
MSPFGDIEHAHRAARLRGRKAAECANRAAQHQAMLEALQRILMASTMADVHTIAVEALAATGSPQDGV